MLKRIKKNQKGFTLVELVVVIAILAILAALMVPRIVGSVDDAKKSRAVADARALASEIAVYNAQAKASNAVPAPALQLAGDDNILDAAELNATLAVTTFPDHDLVHILIDADGNCTVDDTP